MTILTQRAMLETKIKAFFKKILKQNTERMS